MMQGQAIPITNIVDLESDQETNFDHHWKQPSKKSKLVIPCNSHVLHPSASMINTNDLISFFFHFSLYFFFFSLSFIYFPSIFISQILSSMT